MDEEERRALSIYAAAWELFCGPAQDSLMKFHKAVTGSNARNIVGRRGGSSRRQYVCNICGDIVDTESAKYSMTRHASEAIDRHVAMHWPADAEILFLDDFRFRRMAEEMGAWDRERFVLWREGLTWAVQYLGEPWPPDCGEPPALPMERRGSRATLGPLNPPPWIPAGKKEWRPED